MKLSQIFGKLMKYPSNLNFAKSNKNINKNWKNIETIFGDFSVNYRQTADDFYLNNHSTIPVAHFVYLYSSKDAKI